MTDPWVTLQMWKTLPAVDLGRGPAIMGGILLAYLFLTIGIAVWERWSRADDD